MDKRKYDIAKDSISIEQFVHQYLGIEQVDCSGLRHVGLKSFESPLVIGVSNNYANKNPELVKTGVLLIVLDCRKNKGTYFNPLLLQELLDKENVEENLKQLQQIRIQDLQEIASFYIRYQETIERYQQLENFYRILEDLNKEQNIEKVKQHQKFFDRLHQQ